MKREKSIKQIYMGKTIALGNFWWSSDWNLVISLGSILGLGTRIPQAGWHGQKTTTTTTTKNQQEAPQLSG